MVTAKTVSFEDDDEAVIDKPENRWKVGNNRKNNNKSKKPNENTKSFQLLNSGRNRYKNPGFKPKTQDDRSKRDLKPEQIMKRMKEKQKVKDFQKSRLKINKKKGRK